MSNYVKATNFTAKDSLQTGNPSKIIKGAEIDDEFNAIATAIATKPDSNSPTLTGVPVAPTAPAGTNTTQLATTAFATTAIQAALQVVYPVGSIYISTVATSPLTLFGFGTWQAFGAGRVLIGASGSGIYVAGNLGGNADSIVVDHNHTGTTSTTTALTGSATNISETWNGYGTTSGIFSKVGGFNAGGTPTSTDFTGSGQLNINANHNHTFTTESTGISGTNANLQPYVVVYMWNRTA